MSSSSTSSNVTDLFWWSENWMITASSSMKSPSSSKVSALVFKSVDEIAISPMKSSSKGSNDAPGSSQSLQITIILVWNTISIRGRGRMLVNEKIRAHKRKCLMSSTTCSLPAELPVQAVDGVSGHAAPSSPATILPRLVTTLIDGANGNLKLLLLSLQWSSWSSSLGSDDADGVRQQSNRDHHEVECLGVSSIAAMA